MGWVVGGVAFAVIAIAVVFVGWKAVKRQGTFEPMTADELAAEDDQP
jgi:membrane protein implicated in regulation of membrane protease activity